MYDSGTITLRKVLAVAAAVEIATGIALLVSPALVVGLLIHDETTELVLVVARMLGITMVALGLGCWPTGARPGNELPALRGMLVYNGLVACLLAYAGVVLHIAGLLLWPAVGLHGVLALLLIWRPK